MRIKKVAGPSTPAPLGFGFMAPPPKIVGGTMALLESGTRAPEFSLNCTPDQKLSLSDFKGRPVVLVFYPADWSPVCGDQLGLYNELLPEFGQFNAQLLAISVDLAWSHTAYVKDRKLRFPLLSDVHPHDVSARYGAFREKEGVCERALFVIDPGGVIRWSYLSPIGVNPGADGILRALESLAKQPSKKEAAHGTR
jgi:peroxiredoxin